MSRRSPNLSKLPSRTILYNSKARNIDFWIDADGKNIEYSSYVLPWAVLIHVIAFLSIDMMLNSQDIFLSLIMRLIPILYISSLYLGLKIENKFITEKYTFLLFLAGIISVIPVIHHSMYEITQNNHFYGGALGVILLKVLMITFVLLPRIYVLSLYLILDASMILAYSYFVGDLFLPYLLPFATVLIFTDIALIISYKITLDLRKDNFYKSQGLEQAFEQKNKYFNILAHDVKSPVNLMQSVINLIKNGDISDERKEHYIDRIGLQLDSLNKLVLNILDWIKTSGEIKLIIEKINVSEILNHILDLNTKLILDKKIKIFNDCPDDIFINYDKQSLEIIFNNLLRNAIKFSYQGGSIFIDCQEDKFIIKNSGVQMSPEQIDKFNEGEMLSVKNGTLGEKGHGLGLEIIKTLAFKNNGELIIEKQDEYNCFYLIF
jgi:signal transduction histidine kinase